MVQQGNRENAIPKKMPPPPPRFSFSRDASHLSNAEEPRNVDDAMYCALSTTASDDNVNPADERMLGKSLDSSTGFLRPRAESLDIRKSHATLGGLDLRGFRGRSDVDDSPELDVDDALATSEAMQTPSLHRRRRSLSLNLPSPSRGSPDGCDTIYEEPVGEVLQRILEGDS
jgi:hypothetical protein